MSYDICIYNKKRAPKVKKGFHNWVEENTNWNDHSDYDDISIASKELQEWYKYMLQYFPAMNGRDSKTSQEKYATANGVSVDEAIDSCADYSINADLIYVAFGYSQAEKACRLGSEKASELGLGFYDPQKDDEPLPKEEQLPIKENAASSESKQRKGTSFRTKLEKNDPYIGIVIVTLGFFYIAFDKWNADVDITNKIICTLIWFLLCGFIVYGTIKQLQEIKREYKDFQIWLDVMLSSIIPDDIVAFYFNLYENEYGNYCMQLIGTSSFDKDDDDWACDNLYCSRVLKLESKKPWQDVLIDMKANIEQYLKQGRYRSILCSKEGIGLGFADGDIELIRPKI